MATKNKMTLKKIELEEFLTVALSTPQSDPSDNTCIWGIPTNLVGLSGIGKTERVSAIGRSMGLKVWPVYVTTKQPEDFTGALVPTPNGIIIECILPAARRCIEDGCGIIFLDEISDARPAVQAACHSFVNERRVGDHVLPPRTRIVLAMNPPERATAGFGLSGPMANRMAHVDYPTPSWEDWVSWLQHQNKLNLDKVGDLETKVRKNYPNVWPTVVGLGAGYMKARQGEGLHKQPDPDHPDIGKAWPSPRTWNWTLRAIAAVRCLGAAKDLELQFAKSLLGDGTATELFAWLRDNDLGNPEEMLLNGWQPSITRADRDYACIQSMTAFATSRQSTKDKYLFATKLWHILKNVIEKGQADLIVQSGKALVENNLANEAGDQALVTIASEVIFELTTDGMAKYA